MRDAVRKLLQSSYPFYVCFIGGFELPKMAQKYPIFFHPNRLLIDLIPRQ
jgi:hypothetical protein